MSLLTAAKDNNTKLFLSLLSKPSIQGLHDKTKDDEKNIMHYIVQHNNLEMLKALLQKNPGVAKTLLLTNDKTNTAPLINLVISNRQELFKALLKLNFDIVKSLLTKKDTGGLALIDFILIKGKTEFFLLLKEILTNNFHLLINPLQAATFTSNIGEFTQFASQENYLHAVLNIFPSPLVIAAANNQLRFLEHLLIQYEWDLVQIKLALGNAFTCEHKDVIGCLLIWIKHSDYDLKQVAMDLPIGISKEGYILFLQGVAYLKKNLYWLAAEAFCNSLNVYINEKNQRSASYELDNLIEVMAAIAATHEYSEAAQSSISHYKQSLAIIKDLHKSVGMPIPRIKFFNPKPANYYCEKAYLLECYIANLNRKDDTRSAINLLQKIKELYQCANHQAKIKSTEVALQSLATIELHKLINVINGAIENNNYDQAVEILIQAENLYCLVDDNVAQGYTLTYIATLAAHNDNKISYYKFALEAYKKVNFDHPMYVDVKNEIASINAELSKLEKEELRVHSLRPH